MYTFAPERVWCGEEARDDGTLGCPCRCHLLDLCGTCGDPFFHWNGDTYCECDREEGTPITKGKGMDAADTEIALALEAEAAALEEEIAAGDGSTEPGLAEGTAVLDSSVEARGERRHAPSSPKLQSRRSHFSRKSRRTTGSQASAWPYFRGLPSA